MKLLGVGVLGSVLLVSGRQAFGQSAHEVASSADKLELHNVKAQAATYQGRAAVCGNCVPGVGGLRSSSVRSCHPEMASRE